MDVVDVEVLSVFVVYVCVVFVVLIVFGIVRKYVLIYIGWEYLWLLKMSGCVLLWFDASANRGGAREACSITYGWIVYVLMVVDFDIVYMVGLDVLVFLRIV